jgi:hypothetical protein
VAARWFTEGYAEEMPEIARIDRGPGGAGANEAGLAAAYHGMRAGTGRAT